ncbi:MAG TPA: cellulose biosynthesis cyclic di-GMP-binding regulatory protein BcsB [Burkholderiaceae bacterium]|nr:cellulose biosynthesis cyclic di-GMP-binding regulatory protein BcsB [Burkholderiaceae bacterium]
MPALAFFLAGMASPGLAASTASVPTGQPALQRQELPAVSTRRFPLLASGKQQMARLRPAEAPIESVFGRRLDEAVISAAVRVRYTFSPMLLPAQSHVRVLLNGEVVGLLPVAKSDAGREIVQEINLPVQAVRRFDRLQLELIGHYTNACEDPLHDGMWLDILSGSEIVLQTRAISLQNDLALLPEPFFDSQDFDRLELPYVFGAQPSLSVLQAAGVTASWFGKLAAWRGARFPVLVNTLPRRHGVVFATNAERPAFLRSMPPFGGPALSVIDNPAGSDGKLLLVTGRDGNDLQVAARALTLNSAALSGARIAIVHARTDRPRQPYDAPNWVRNDRPMRFGELTASPLQLQGYGHLPPTVRFDLRIPPDLFTWRTRGVPVDLKLRYTPPVPTAESVLQMDINGEPVQRIRLEASGEGGESARVVLPLLGPALFGNGREILIPAFRLGTRNELAYRFAFAYTEPGACRDVQVDTTRAMIDPDSTVDFSGFPHYAEMPHLGYFATAGFPFTKYADLSQTAVVMPRQPQATDIAVMLSLLARMGESTGYPATQVAVVGPDDAAALVNRDLLVIGVSAAQPLLQAWRAQLPAIIDGPQRGIRLPADMFNRFGAWFGRSAPIVRDPAPQKHLRGNGPLAALLALESPLTAGRSVVMATAAETADLPLLLDMLDNDQQARSLVGSVALVHGGIAESLYAGKTYTLGMLPPWIAVWHALSGHPVLLALMSVLAVLIFGLGLWRSLKTVAARRLQDHSHTNG